MLQGNACASTSGDLLATGDHQLAHQADCWRYVLQGTACTRPEASCLPQQSRFISAAAHLCGLSCKESFQPAIPDGMHVNAANGAAVSPAIPQTRNMADAAQEVMLHSYILQLGLAERGGHWDGALRHPQDWTCPACRQLALPLAPLGPLSLQQAPPAATCAARRPARRTATSFAGGPRLPRPPGHPHAHAVPPGVHASLP